MKYLFIINPIFREVAEIENALRESFANTCYELIRIKESDNEAKYIEKVIYPSLNAGHLCVTAAGGDGTVRSVAEAIVNLPSKNTFITMGILPIGSGNMIARELGIPVNNTKKAIELLLNHKTIRNIDVLEICDSGALGRKICVACIGFRISAVVAESYNKSIKRRGLFSYIYHILKSYKDFEKIRFQRTTLVFFDREEVVDKAILLSLQNLSAWGYGVKVCNAKPDDGLFNCVILDGNRIKTLFYALRLFRGAFPTRFLAERVTITREREGVIQIDGDTFYAGKELSVRVLPASLNVIVK